MYNCFSLNTFTLHPYIVTVFYNRSHKISIWNKEITHYNTLIGTYIQGFSREIRLVFTYCTCYWTRLFLCVESVILHASYILDK